ncbi:MAG: helix-turn-helix domain-containing protein [bacterium]
MIEETLQNIGLTDKEIQVFLTVFQNKRILPARISTLSGINRSTVYVIGEKLEKEGLITIDYGNSSRYFVAPDIQDLEKQLKQEEEKLQKKEQSYKNLLKELKNLPVTGKYSVPKIRFIAEHQLKDFLIKESDKWAKSALLYDKTWWGYQDPTLLEQYESWPDYFWPKYKNDILMKIFTNKKIIEKKISKKNYSGKRMIKFLDPKKHDFSATQVVVGEYILMIVTREHPHYLIEIHDAVMAHNLRESFKLMWGE